MKRPEAKGSYNLLFQQTDSYKVQPQSRFNKNNNTTYVRALETWDSGISCHVFAIQSPYTWNEANQVNQAYVDVVPLNHFIDPQNNPWNRAQTLEAIQLYVQQNNEVALPVANLQLCGGNHNPGDLQPEHMWLEDHTNNRTYDTFIDRGGIAVVDGVGGLNQDFQPGCEGSAFHYNQIERRQIAGYTWGHLLALASGAEGYIANPIPDALENSPEMVLARKIVNDLQSSYDIYMDKVTTQEQRDAFDVYRNGITAIQTREVIGKAQVDVDNAKQIIEQEINAVFNNLTLEQQTHVNEYKAACEKAEDHMRPIAIKHATKLINLFKIAKERMEATLAAVPEEGGKRDSLKTLLEKKRDEILKEDDLAVALEAFNKSMSDGNIKTLAQGIKDGLKAHNNLVFDAQATKLMDELMTSYVENDGKLEKLSQTLTTNERIGATLAAVPEEGGARDFLKALLEKKRDDILKEPDPEVALDAFNKSMSDGHIIVLTQGIKDSLEAHDNPMLQEDAELRAHFDTQMKKVMDSYAKNDGKIAELSLNLCTEKNQLAASSSYTAVLAVTNRIQAMQGLHENVTNYAQNLVNIMKTLPIEQRINFPHSKEQATYDAIQALLTTNKAEPAGKVDETTSEVGQKILDKLTNIKEFLDQIEQQEELQVQNN